MTGARANTTGNKVKTVTKNGSYLLCFEMLAKNLDEKFELFDIKIKEKTFRLNSNEAALNSQLKEQLPHFDRMQINISKEIEALPTTSFGKNLQADPLRNRLAQIMVDVTTYTEERQKLIERMNQFSRLKKTAYGELSQWKKEGRPLRSIEERLDQLEKQRQTIEADTKRLNINEESVRNKLIALQRETHQAVINAKGAVVLQPNQPYTPT